MGLRSALTAPLLLPWAAATAVHPRWRRDWAQRWSLRPIPAQPGSVWIHAASVGEVRAALGLARELPGPVLLTADTDTGAAVARASAEPGTVAGVRPVDHPWVLAPLWADARPRAVVFVEGAWWPALAAQAVCAGVPVARVSARPGRTGTHLPASVARRWFGAASLVVARSADDARELERVHDAPVRVGGDLKASAPMPASPLRWARPFVVAASSRGDDAAPLVRAAHRLDPPPQVLVAPRHPARCDALHDALVGEGWSVVRRSRLAGSPAPVPPEADVVLLDTLGELAGALRGAEAALIGGTFDAAIGGHSPVEARRHGVPVLAGPHRHAQSPDAFAEAIDVDVLDALPDALAAAFVHTGPRPPPDDAARRTARLLTPLLDAPAPESSPRPWARPLSPVVASVAALRDLPWDRGWRRPHRVPVPVVSVGSTNARSPGRTSTVRWLVGRLQDRGHTVGVALRGYRRARRGRDVRLSTHTRSAADLGDEGALLAETGALVAAGPDRVAGARALVAAGATVIVLDDGLQHRRLHRDRELVIVDARYPEARGLLPAGERRERHAVPTRADHVVVHHGDAVFSAPGVSAVRRPGPWRPGPPPHGSVAAFCGIGRPADFLASLQRPVARFRALSDHQPVGPELAAELRAWSGGLPLVCTPKDAVRLPGPLREQVFVRDLIVELPEWLVEGL